MIFKYLKKRRITYNNEFSFVWKKPFFNNYLSISNRINPHIAIVGQSGSGKSNAANVIIQMLSEDNFNLIILDPKSDYVGLANSINAKVINAKHNGINIFERGMASINEKTSELSTILQKYLRLGHVQSNLLYRCIKYTYEICERKTKEPSFSSLIFTLKVFKKNAELKNNKTEANMLEYLLTRFTSLEYLDTKNTIKISEAVNSRTIILLKGLGTVDAQSIFMEGILKQIYTYAIMHGESSIMKLYIVVDEAGKLGDNPILGRLVSEGRKYGIGIISISQTAKTLDRDVRCNSSLFISFYTREPEELNYVSSFISGGNEGERSSRIKTALRSLSVGEAVAVDYYHKEPLILKFGRVKNQTPPMAYILDELTRAVIREKELRNELRVNGFIDHEIDMGIKTLKNNKNIQQYTIKYGCAYDDTWYLGNVLNTPEHDISVGIIALQLKRFGFYVKIHNTSYGPDIIAEKDGIKYAIEYETGLKNLNETKNMITERIKNYDRVIVLCKKTDLINYNSITGVLCMSMEDFLVYEECTAFLSTVVKIFNKVSAK